MPQSAGKMRVMRAQNPLSGRLGTVGASLTVLLAALFTTASLLAAGAKKSKRDDAAPSAPAASAPAAAPEPPQASSTQRVAPVPDAGVPPQEPATPPVLTDGGYAVVDPTTPAAEAAPVVANEGRNFGWLDTRVSDRSPNQWGQTGLVRVNSARAGAGGYFDLGGHGRAFYTAQEAFPANGPFLGGPFITDCARYAGKRDCDTYLAGAMWGSLHVGVTLFDYVELSAATVASGAENSEVKPRTILSTGSLALSGKLSLPVVVWTRNLAKQLKLKKPMDMIFPVPLAFGLDMRAYVPSRSDALGLQLDNFSLAPTLLASLDFWEQRKWPFRAHANLGYIYQHVLSLERQVEGQSVLPVADRRRYFAGARGHVTAVALDYTYWDRITYGTGIEFPLPFVTPFVEYTGEIPLPAPWKPGPFIYRATGPLADSPIGGTGFALFNPLTWNSRLTPGLRITPGRGLAFDVAADLGLGGRYALTNGVAAQWPWALYAGMSYAFSPFVAETSVEVRQVEKKVMVAVEKPHGRVAGRVLDAVSGKPIADARLTLPNGKGPRFLAGPDGRFESYDLMPGTQEVQAEAPDYEPGSVTTSVPVNGAVQVDIRLKPHPRLSEFFANVVNEKDESVPASITLTDSRGNTMLLSAQDGSVRTELPPGRYNAVARADGYLLSGKNIVVEPGIRTNEVFMMKLEPKKRMTVLTREKIEIKSTIFFEYNKARLLSASFFLLDEVVDTLLKNPQVTKLRVEGHTDNTGTPEYNQQLSQARAEAVRDYLVQNGVAAERLEAGGFGDARPVAPNTNEAGRAKNRRVEFVIVTQDNGGGAGAGDGAPGSAGGGKP